MAEEAKTEQKFFKVEMIHIFSAEPERMILIPHVGPEGFISDKVEVRASKLECWGSVDDVIYERDLISLYMRWPATCTLKDGVLTCRLGEG